MTPAARIQTGIDLWEKILASRLPMDSTIGDFMRGRRFIGAKDRAEIAERAYGMMRHFARLGWMIAHYGESDTPRNRMLAFLILVAGGDAKRMSQLFDGSKHGPADLDTAEKDFVGKLTQGDGLANTAMPAIVRAECPPEHAQRLSDVFGQDFDAEMAAMQIPATLDLRVNVFLAERSKVQDYMTAAGVATEPTVLSPWGLRCAGKAYLSKTKAFHKGWIEIQDEGSQLIALACDAQPGMQVLDYCAGAGGKTLALASAMRRKGRIVAMDTEVRRLEKGKERFRKAQVADIIEVRPLSEDRHKKWLRRQKETFDRVLVDVPCTGSGTWRRNPDMRWKTYGTELQELCSLQSEILDRVAHTLKPGGRLVYATCSLFREENEDQVAAFLARHPDFSLIEQPLPDYPQINMPQCRLSPRRNQTDAFFWAVMTRSST